MLSIKNQYTQLLTSFSESKKSAWGATPAASNATNLTSEIVTFLLKQAIISRASDIHLEPRPDKVMVRFRIDGKLHDVLDVDTNANINILPRIKLLAGIPTDLASSKKSWDGRFSTEINAAKFDFRVATFPTILGDKIALRIIIKDNDTVDLKKIGLTPQDSMRLERIIQRKSGLIVVSGPTGGGKTTTLYSILRRLQNPSVNIVTLEDPVEYQVDGINQCDLKNRGQGDEDFISGLKSILRQDPDIIMIGEIRDAQSAEIAVRASITGHLVLTSLHANSAIGTIVRLMNMGLESHVVSYALIGALAQRLVRKICDGCKVPQKIDHAAILRLCAQCGINSKLFFPTQKPATAQSESLLYSPSDVKNNESVTLYKGAGCEHCSGTGYRGRVGVFEFVGINEEMRDAIINKATAATLEQLAIKEGFQSLVVDAIQKAKAGLVSIDDIYPILLEKSA